MLARNQSYEIEKRSAHRRPYQHKDCVVRILTPERYASAGTVYTSVFHRASVWHSIAVNLTGAPSRWNYSRSFKVRSSGVMPGAGFGIA